MSDNDDDATSRGSDVDDDATASNVDDDDATNIDDNDDDNESKLDEREEDQERKVQLVERPLNKLDLAAGLSMLCKTGDGLAHAFVRLESSERELTDVSILENFSHLRYVNLNKNLLKTLRPLEKNRHLILLEANENKLEDLGLYDLQYVRRMSLNNNHLTNFECFCQPQLELLSLRKRARGILHKADISVIVFVGMYGKTRLPLDMDTSGDKTRVVVAVENNLTSFDDLLAEKLTNLHTLELRGNQIENISGLNLPNIKFLYMAENKLKSLEGLEKLVNLEVVHLRDNPIETLKGLSENNIRLERMNLRSTKVKNINELKRLYRLPALKILTLMESPLSDEESYRAEVLIHCRALERLDKEPLSDEEKQESAAIRSERVKDNLMEIDDLAVISMGESSEEEEEEDEEEENEEEKNEDREADEKVKDDDADDDDNDDDEK